MKGLTTALAQAKTEAKICKNGKSTSSSATLTNIRGKKQTKKHKKMVNIILVKRISSLLWADCAALANAFFESFLPTADAFPPAAGVLK